MKIVAILMVSMTYLAVCRSDVLNVNDKGNETSIKEGPKMMSKTAMDLEVKSQNNRTETPLVEETETDYNYLVQVLLVHYFGMILRYRGVFKTFELRVLTIHNRLSQDCGC